MLSLSVIFVAGAVTGSVITFQIVKQLVRSKSNPDQWSTRVLREYKRRLNLSAEQIERIRPRLMEANQDLKNARSEFARAHGQVFLDIHASLDEELTPEQRQSFRRLRTEQLQRFHARPETDAGMKRSRTNGIRPIQPPWQQRSQRQREMMLRERPRQPGNPETDTAKRRHSLTTDSPPPKTDSKPESK